MPKSRQYAAIDSRGQGAPGAPRQEEADRESSLPLILTEDRDIEAICLLVHAGQAKAVMQIVVDPSGGMPQPGVVVSEITPSGWMTLQASRSKGKA